MKLYWPALILIGAGIGLTIGFALRPPPLRVSVAPPIAKKVTDAVSVEVPDETARVPEPSFGGRRDDDSPLATQLERDLSWSSGVTRWLYWMEALEKAVASDFPRLARLAEGHPSTVRLVATRWIEVDPRHLFDSLVTARKEGRPLLSGEWVDLLFREWSQRDPDAVIAALNGLDRYGRPAHEPGQFESWRMSAVDTLIQDYPELGLRMMSDWDIHNYLPHMNGVARWAALDSRHAAEFALAHPTGFASRSVMETIGREWAKSDPGGALAFAIGQPGKLGTTLASAVLKEWAGSNREGAAEWLVGTDPRTRHQLSSAFVESWAREDAAGAVAWCQENLTGSSLARAVGGVAKGAAERDATGTAAWVAAMSPSPARTEAARAVAQKLFSDHNSSQPVTSETIAWLNQLDADAAKRVVSEINWRWLEADPASLAAFVAAAPPDRIPKYSYSALARTLARQNPAESLEWARRLPEERGLSAGGEAFNEWRRFQPESAMKWLNDLPEADPRRPAFFQRVIQSLAYEPQAVEQLTALKPAERTTARDIIAKMTLSGELRSRLLEALDPP